MRIKFAILFFTAILVFSCNNKDDLIQDQFPSENGSLPLEEVFEMPETKAIFDDYLSCLQEGDIPIKDKLSKIEKIEHEILKWMNSVCKDSVGRVDILGHSFSLMRKANSSLKYGMDDHFNIRILDHWSEGAYSSLKEVEAGKGKIESMVFLLDEARVTDRSRVIDAMNAAMDMLILANYVMFGDGNISTSYI